MKTTKAFTLIELTTTIIIISILASLGLPKILEQKNFIESIFNKKIFHSLLFAQNMAISSGCHIAIILNTDFLELYLRNSCKTGNFNQNILDPTNLPNIYRVTIPSNLSLNSSNFPIYFDHNGQARSVNTNAISDSNINIEGGKFNYSISIHGFNGKIEEI